MSQEMRFTVNSQNGPLTDVVHRALMEVGGWSIEAMRRPGFRLMEQVESELQLQFRTAAPMPDKAQVAIDRAVVEVGLQRLTIAADIMAAGLTYNLTDPLSIAQLEWNTVSKVGAAQRTMSPSARTENKLPIVTPNRLPIYLTTDKFEIDIRTLKTSQRIGLPLDTTLVKQCTRAVNEAIEDAVINGTTTLDGQPLAVGGYSAPGLLNATNANTQTLTASAWAGTTPSGATVLSELQQMIAKLQGDKKFGPYRLYIPTNVANAFNVDYSTSAGQLLTIRQRMLQMEGLEAIRTADLLPQGTGSPAVGAKVVLVQMTSDVVDMVVGQEPTVIPWTSLDGFMIHNLVMAIMIPRIKSDAEGNSGIVVGTTA